MNLVYIFCLINICSSTSDEANKIKPLNIERVSQFVSLSFWKCLLVELKRVGKFSGLFFGLFLTNFWTLNSSQACIFNLSLIGYSNLFGFTSSWICLNLTLFPQLWTYLSFETWNVYMEKRYTCAIFRSLQAILKEISTIKNCEIAGWQES